MNRNAKFALALGASLVALVATGLFFVYRMGLTQDILNVIMLLLGMLAVSAVLIFFQAFDSNQRGPFIVVHFNEGINNQALESASKVVDAEVISPTGAGKRDQDDGFSAASFVGRDNQLALAKLRMDLEKEIQSAAEASGIFQSELPLNPTRLFTHLVEKGVVDASLASVVKEVFSACSKAIHGGEVDNTTTESIVRVGLKLVTAIRHAGKSKTTPKDWQAA